MASKGPGPGTEESGIFSARLGGSRAVPPELLARLEALFPGSPHEIGGAVRALSEDYVRGEGPAVDSKARRAAYGRYYLPANYLKLHLPLRELSLLERADLARRKEVRVLDLGSGPGTFLLSAIGYLADQGAAPSSIDLIACDRDRDFLGAAKALVPAWAREKLPGAGARFLALAQDLFAPLPESAAREGFDLIVLGNALCEWADGRCTPAEAATQVRRLLALLREEGALVLLEPALRRTSRFLLATRDALLAGGGVHLYSPCLHEGPCPALVRSRDWCHERLPWDLPPALAALDRIAGLEKDALAFSYAVLRRSEGSLRDSFLVPGPGLGVRGRVVSDPLPERGKSVCASCTEAARLVYFEALQRPPGHAAAALAGLSRGDIALFPEGRLLGDGSVRLLDEAPPRRLG